MKTLGALCLRVACPECGGATRVYKTCADGITRKLECKACGHRFRVLVEYKPPMKTMNTDVGMGR